MDEDGVIKPRLSRKKLPHFRLSLRHAIACASISNTIDLTIRAVIPDFIQSLWSVNSVAYSISCGDMLCDHRMRCHASRAVPVLLLAHLDVYNWQS